MTRNTTWVAPEAERARRHQHQRAYAPAGRRRSTRGRIRAPMRRSVGTWTSEVAGGAEHDADREPGDAERRARGTAPRR